MRPLSAALLLTVNCVLLFAVFQKEARIETDKGDN